MKSIEYDEYGFKIGYNDIASEGKTNRSTSDLLREYKRLENDDHSHMTERAQEEHIFKTAMVEFALIRRYFESHNLPEWAVVKCIDGEWEQSEINEMLRELQDDNMTM